MVWNHVGTLFGNTDTAALQHQIADLQAQLAQAHNQDDQALIESLRAQIVALQSGHSISIILTDDITEQPYKPHLELEHDEADNALVLVDELVNYLSGVNANSVQRGEAARILKATISELELRLNRVFQPALFSETLTVPLGGGLVFLRHTPIVGLVESEPEVVLHPSLPAVVVPAGVDRVVVTYRAGGIMCDAVKAAVLRVASREFLSRHNDTVALNSGSASAPKVPASSPIGWQDDEIQALSRLRRVVVS